MNHSFTELLKQSHEVIFYWVKVWLGLRGKAKKIDQFENFPISAEHYFTRCSSIKNDPLDE